MSLSVSFNLVGPGWAECIITVDGNSTVLTASYLENALGNLAEATLKLAQGEKISYAIFAEEPGEYRWRFSKLSDTEISVEILEFDAWKGMRQSDDKGRVILKFQCPLLVLIRRIIICLSEVLERHGLQGYAEKWMMHEFPSKDYNELRNTLPILKKRLTK